MTENKMTQCKYCGGDYPLERATIGYDYCMASACVAKGKKPLKFMEVGHNKTASEVKVFTEEAVEELKHTGRRGR